MLKLNKIQITGRVGQITLHNSGSTPFGSLRIAYDDSYTRSDGTRVEQTLWLNVVANDKNATFVEKYVGKGDLLYIEGRLKERTYTDRDGNERTSLEVNAHSVQLVAKKSDAAGAQKGDDDDLPDF